MTCRAWRGGERCWGRAANPRLPCSSRRMGLGTNRTALVLGLWGLLCPIPVVKLAQAIKTVQVGDLIEATATDPGVLADIPAWCRSTGHELVSIGRAEKIIRFAVRRVK